MEVATLLHDTNCLHRADIDRGLYVVQFAIFKHGKADQVKIRFEGQERGFVEIVIEDNGRGLPSQFRPGLGSELLDEIAYPWSLVKIPVGVRLVARIPVGRKA